MPAVQKLLYVIYSLLYLCCHAMCFYSRYMQKVCEVLTTLPLLAIHLHRHYSGLYRGWQVLI